MLSKKVLTGVLSLSFIFALRAIAITEMPKGTEALISEVSKPKLLGEADLKVLGGELHQTAKYLRKAYYSYSMVPGTAKLISSAIEEDDFLRAIIWGIILLPIDFAVTSLYGNFRGAYYFGRAGNHLMVASNVLPQEQAILMERSGNNLKTCQTIDYAGSALFCGGVLSGTANLWEKKSLTYPLIIMGIGHGLKLFSIHYADLSGKDLQEISKSPISIEPFKAIGKGGKELQNYRKWTYWGSGLMTLGVATTIVGKNNSTAMGIGILTTMSGIVLSGSIAKDYINSASYKLDEASDRLIHWKMSLQKREDKLEPMVAFGFNF